MNTRIMAVASWLYKSPLHAIQKLIIIATTIVDILQMSSYFADEHSTITRVGLLRNVLQQYIYMQVR